MHGGASQTTLRQSFSVRYEYPVYFTADLFDAANPLLAQVLAATDAAPAQLLFIVDQNLAVCNVDLAGQIESYCAGHRALRLAHPIVSVPGGETCKNDPQYLTRLHQAIFDAHLCRHSYVLGVGGGAVLDLVGYAAATAHRGIRHIRIPSTVLAQNDSGVGVKNAINAMGRKNFLGTFAPPFAVINDRALLRTLPDRAWRSGIIEAVKVALIKDAAFFAQLEAAAPALLDRDMTQMQALIHRCASLHLQHIGGGGDPFEAGSSRPLDFGHWAAHKLEQLTGNRLDHGEAVAIGIALDASYALRAGLLPRADFMRIIQLIRTLHFQLSVPEMTRHPDDPSHPDALLHGLEEFRQHLGGTLTIMLLRGIGQGIEVNTIDSNLMLACIRDLCQLIP